MPPKSTTKCKQLPTTQSKKKIPKKQTSTQAIKVVNDEANNKQLSTSPKKKITKKKTNKTRALEDVDDEPNIQKPPSKKKCTRETDDDEKCANQDNKETKRFPNYKEDKDVEICRSWLEISEDPLNGMNQSANTFWDRVCEHYLAKILTYKRPLKSIKTRWQTIQRSVNKFNGCYKQLQQANQSGSNAEDRIGGALKLYAAWIKYCASLGDKSKDTESDLPSSSGLFNLSLKSNCSDAASNAKEARLQELRDIKWKDDLVKVQRDLASKSQAQNAILAEQKDAMVAMADESIMLTDPSTINPAGRAYFEWKQSQIMNKIMQQQAEAKEKEEEEKKRRKKIKKGGRTEIKRSSNQVRFDQQTGGQKTNPWKEETSCY
ncbi:hypothetical protein PTTG_26263 [Puccinia triticina 1-1 BBBD Race 1]|uniref:NAM-associated domain-containing protein n=1 Tax=Puccinia triticina (isolate 1-1 / race 1 (BBBD)) TaxID=630390 RepID=A0A180GVH8_PUCT1|nr:hypothetical protein PTTG_26263 [Puccinia triticina 1-1 BBBD Race 1]